MLPPLLAGLGLGLSLIVAIGAQNLFVLRQGIRREHVLAVVVVCAASDAILIVLGVSGVGLALAALPWLVTAVRWAGAAFLVGYGLLAARRAWRPAGALTVDDPRDDIAGSATERPVQVQPTTTATRLSATVLTVLALTWLNPHVYLDTVFLLGGVANTHGDDRWLFALGAVMASILWFSALGFGARYLGRWLATPRAWRILDAIIAVVMIVLGVSLVVGG
ncbi:MAG TPA: amino acid transporter [Microbacterium sp.]|uniref:LysE/ArgO family amino acid transporter n=1 Tax=Microbacterium TaxID=33882 RepID=UPI000E052419|nr:MULTISPECIES: LysE/ArgO family amino acid transporter [Microbacterium]MEC8762659.1 LysE/ArgO family amino acid transporter [Actinomycetota bacterium]RCL84977.1 MAG: amino acid transporter [Microbacterium sp.]MCC4267478.1 LysE/ArgO family amino acid transporter [Microbacterium schleiferi]HAJ17924.1 amino acid transporter [Microbacterium sp.]HBS09206.1 amino acid transporter [Microbacterium sp.]